MDSKEKDWKLYKKNIGAWQERYMDKILEEYKEIIDRKEMASKDFGIFIIELRVTWKIMEFLSPQVEII